MKKQLRKPKSYPKREWLVIVDGQVISDHNDMPFKFSQQVAKANVNAKIADGHEAYMAKIGRDVILGGE